MKRAFFDLILEYVIVEYKGQCQVLVNGETHGETNQLIQLEAGAHEFSLETPAKSGSATALRIVKGTSATNPVRIKFDAAYDENYPDFQLENLST